MTGRVSGLLGSLCTIRRALKKGGIVQAWSLYYSVGNPVLKLNSVDLIHRNKDPRTGHQLFTGEAGAGWTDGGGTGIRQDVVFLTGFFHPATCIHVHVSRMSFYHQIRASQVAQW